MDNDIDINKLKLELLDLKTLNTLNESRVKKLTAEKESILRENEELKDRLVILENNLNSLKITFSDKAKDFSENEDRIDQLRADILSLESKNKIFESNNKELEKQIENLKSENSNLNLDLQMLKSEKSYLDSELNKAYSEIEDVKSAKKSDFDLPEDELLDNETNHNIDTASIETIVDIVKKQFEIDMANFVKVLIDEEKKKLEEIHKRDVSKIEDLNKEIVELKDENLKRCSDCQTLYSIRQNLERELYAKNNEIKTLNAENRTIESKLRDYKNDMQNLERELSVKNDEIKILNAENRVIGSKLKNNGSFVAKKKMAKKK